MDYNFLKNAENEEIALRCELAFGRISQIPCEKTVKENFTDYFQKTAKFILKIKELMQMLENGVFDKMSICELKKLNHQLYEDILDDNYKTSYANPAYAAQKTGKYGKLLSFVYTEIRGMIVYAFENRITDIVINAELFLEIYNIFEYEQMPKLAEVKKIIYWFVSDYSDITISYRIRECIDDRMDFATKIIMESNLEDISYLYKYGEYIGDNEIKTAEFLNTLNQDEIDKVAEVFTEGYRRGFINSGKDLSKKGTVDIRYFLGFERIIKSAIKQFETMGLKPVIYRDAVSSVNRKQSIVGYSSTLPNKQYWYDHRFDSELYLDAAFNERRMGVLKTTYEKYKDIAYKMAGPAVMEIFGEEPFEPEDNKTACHLSKKQQKLLTRYTSMAAEVVSKYIISEERSFTIIAFPIPAIGENFEEIFEETIKINSLDVEKYKCVQQKMINALDEAEYVRVVGKEPNRTYMTISLNKLEDKNTQTNFENCLADVNIPLGEVFTSPVLADTNGILHVSCVYLNELRFNDLEITFENGYIKDYICKNFDNYDENKNYFKENVMYGHETLPIGEFAIGTNTAAYVMANKYDIVYKLPILIVEKMGPHFAVGDTCYSREEDIKVYNPDGREIVARDNEKSILRKENIDDAYVNCHTDITIPYDEIDEISAVKSDGEEIVIIRDGRFVLEGCEILNEPFEAFVANNNNK